MMITVTAMRVMEMSGNQIIHVVAVRNRFVSAGRTMHVIGGMSGTLMSRSTIVRIRAAHGNRMLVIVITMMVMKMAVVEKIHMVLVDNPGVPASWTVNVYVIGFRMDRMGHDYFSLSFSMI